MYSHENPALLFNGFCVEWDDQHHNDDVMRVLKKLRDLTGSAVQPRVRVECRGKVWSQVSTANLTPTVSGLSHTTSGCFVCSTLICRSSRGT